MAPVTAVVIGAGNRGLMYSSYAIDFPEKFKASTNLLFYSNLYLLVIQYQCWVVTCYKN